MSLSLQEILTQAFGFLILVWILKRLFWKPILATLEKRRKKIEEAFRHIEIARQEIETLRSDYEARIAKIEEEGRVKLQSALEEGRRIAREIQEKAREEAKEVLWRTKENLALEVAKARVELRHEIVELTLLATERILREKLTEEKQQEKIFAMIESLEAENEKLSR